MDEREPQRLQELLDLGTAAKQRHAQMSVQESFDQLDRTLKLRLPDLSPFPEVPLSQSDYSTIPLSELDIEVEAARGMTSRLTLKCLLVIALTMSSPQVALVSYIVALGGRVKPRLLSSFCLMQGKFSPKKI